MTMRRKDGPRLRWRWLTGTTRVRGMRNVRIASIGTRELRYSRSVHRAYRKLGRFPDVG